MSKHDCVRRIDAQLAQYNTQIAVGLNFTTGALAIPIGTTKLDSSKRGKPMSLYASFCPFCGVSLNAPKPGDDHE